jgi:hypothetical protein
VHAVNPLCEITTDGRCHAKQGTFFGWGQFSSPLIVSKSIFLHKGCPETGHAIQLLSASLWPWLKVGPFISSFYPTVSSINIIPVKVIWVMLSSMVKFRCANLASSRSTLSMGLARKLPKFPGLETYHYAFWRNRKAAGNFGL